MQVNEDSGLVFIFQEWAPGMFIHSQLFDSDSQCNAPSPVQQSSQYCSTFSLHRSDQLFIVFYILLRFCTELFHTLLPHAALHSYLPSSLPSTHPPHLFSRGVNLFCNSYYLLTTVTVAVSISVLRGICGPFVEALRPLRSGHSEELHTADLERALLLA
jgi:hypothetical protein